MAVVGVEALVKAVILNGDSAKHGPEIHHSIIGKINIILLYNNCNNYVTISSAVLTKLYPEERTASCSKVE